MLSVVIPVLNASDRLSACLASLRDGETRPYQVIVADGGSTDGSCETATAAGATVVHAAQGRGRQLVAGAAAARAKWLLFLHADTWLEPGWAHEARAFMAGEPAAAATFRFALDDPAPQARRLERVVAWRASVLGLPYGDQGLLITRQLYDALGGFRPLPLMEDVDLVRRIGRGRLRLLRSRAFTSAARYRRDGWVRRPARNLACLSLYYLGVPPAALVRLYE